jgi:hypothetical protein
MWHFSTAEKVENNSYKSLAAVKDQLSAITAATSLRQDLAQAPVEARLERLVAVLAPNLRLLHLVSLQDHQLSAASQRLASRQRPHSDSLLPLHSARARSGSRQWAHSLLLDHQALAKLLAATRLDLPVHHLALDSLRRLLVNLLSLLLPLVSNHSHHPASVNLHNQPQHLANPHNQRRPSVSLHSQV